MSITVVSMKIRVKEVSPSKVEEIKDLFRGLLDQTMIALPNFAIEGSTILPRCVGIDKEDRRTLFSGIAVRSILNQFDPLQSALRDNIVAFLMKNNLDTGIPNPVTIDLHYVRNTESEFISAQEKAMIALKGGPQKSSEIAKATGLDDQLNNVLLCMLEEERLISREETHEIDDIFRLVK